MLTLPGKSLFSPSKPAPLPPPPEPPPSQEEVAPTAPAPDPEDELLKRRKRQAAVRSTRSGRLSTIFSDSAETLG